MAYRIEFSAEAECDFEIVFEFLLNSYRGFGEDSETALTHAEARVHAIRVAAESLAVTPQRGTRHDDLLPGLRHVTIDRAVYWFDLDETSQVVRILAVFFGGQDHYRRVLARLLE